VIEVGVVEVDLPGMAFGNAGVFEDPGLALIFQ
jgi:hypothetical protein